MGKFICKYKVTNGNTHMKAAGKKVGYESKRQQERAK